MTVVELADLGLRPDSKGEMSVLLRRILADLRGQSGLRLRFAPGLYHFRQGTAGAEDPDAFFSLKDFTDLHIDGAGSRFVFEGDRTAFVFENCRGLSFSHFDLRYKVELAAAARITARDRHTVELEMSPGKQPWHIRDGRLLLGGDGRPPAAFIEVSGRDYRPVFGAKKMICAEEELEFRARSSNRLLLHSKDEALPETAAELSYMLLLKAWPRRSALRFVNCCELEINNVVAQSLPGSFIETVGCEEVLLSKLRLANSGNVRDVVTAAGAALLCVNGKAKFVIEDCLFEGHWGEALRQYGPCAVLRSRPTADSLLLLTKPGLSEHAFTAEAGDELRLADRISLQPLALAQVSAVEKQSRSLLLLRFRKNLPERLEAGTIVENNSRRVDLTVRNSSFRPGFSSGLCLSPRSGLIRNCTIASPGAGILLGGGLRDGHYEAGPCERLEIRDNMFLDCAYLPELGRAPVSVAPQLPAAPPPYYHRRLILANNYFAVFDKRILYADQLAGVTCSDNRPEYTNSFPGLPGPAYDIRKVGEFTRSYHLY